MSRPFHTHLLLILAALLALPASAQAGCIDLTGASYHCRAPKASLSDIEVSFTQDADQVTIHSKRQGKERSVTEIIDGKFRHAAQEVYFALDCTPQRLRRVSVNGLPLPNQPRNGLVMDYRLDEAGNLIFTVHKGRLPKDDIGSVVLGENLMTKTCQRK